jgi:hypothetical protein
LFGLSGRGQKNPVFIYELAAFPVGIWEDGAVKRRVKIPLFANKLKLQLLTKPFKSLLLH